LRACQLADIKGKRQAGDRLKRYFGFGQLGVRKELQGDKLYERPLWRTANCVER